MHFFLFILEPTIFHTLSFNLFSSYFFQHFSLDFPRAGMGLGFGNGILLVIPSNSYSRSCVYIGCVRMTVVQPFYIMLLAIF